MKLIFVLCTVISFAYGFRLVDFVPELFSDFDVLNVVAYTDELPINDDQIKCIKDGVQTIIDENSDLIWWFDEAEKSVVGFYEDAKKCDSHNDEHEKRKCFTELKQAFQLEFLRLVRLLPADEKGIIDEIKDVVKECF